MGGQMAFEGILVAFFCLVRTPLQTSNNGVKWDFWPCRLFVFSVGQGWGVAGRQMRGNTI